MLLLLGLLVGALNYDYALAQTERPYQQFQEIPVGNGKSVLADLNESPNHELLNRLAKSGDLNSYLLYTRYNPNSPQYLVSDDLSSVQSSYFDPEAPTVVLMHGWQGGPNQEFDISVKNALLQPVPNQTNETLPNVNIIVVDWRRVSSLGYVTAVAGVPLVGKEVAHLLTYLNGTIGAPFTLMHLAGHSLGAHVAANAGKQTGGRLRRITGLDPAGPLWYVNPFRLQPEDAMYVEAIHTNGLVAGIGTEVADADFFANGGSVQPGCPDAGCSHARSYQLFAASIRYNHLVGRKCTGYIQMTLNLCRGDPLPMGNNDLNKFGKGIYRINTLASYPY